jgi:hypothetical protein
MHDQMQLLASLAHRKPRAGKRKRRPRYLGKPKNLMVKLPRALQVRDRQRDVVKAIDLHELNLIVPSGQTA